MYKYNLSTKITTNTYECEIGSKIISIMFVKNLKFINTLWFIKDYKRFPNIDTVITSSIFCSCVNLTIFLKS